MANEWIGVIHTTAPKYLEGAADNTIRKRLFLSMLSKKGRFRFNESSYEVNWDVEFAEQPVEAYGDGGTLNFSRHDLYRQLNIDWRGYKATDMMTEKERLMNDGNLAIVKRYDKIMPKLMRSINNHFCGELFIDGYASGNENRVHGLESFMANKTSPANADRIIEPSDSYGGLKTDLADQGGTWSNDLSTQPNSTLSKDWPDGTGDPEYDYLAPKLVNFGSNGWGTGSETWEDNCERVLRQTTIWMTHTGGLDSKPDMFLLPGDLYYDYLNKQSSKQRIVIPHKEAEDLGFSDTLNQEGVMIHNDYDVPAGTGYGINIDQMELASLDSVLFASRGPEYDIKTDAWLFMVGFFGNARYNPKHFAKIKDFA
jgi:hypothetical protein